MTDKERFLATMRYQSPDRAPFWDFGAWPETVERWKTEGYDPQNPPFKPDRMEACNDWFCPTPPFAHEIISEDARTVTYINEEGILLRERKDHPSSSMPQFLKFPVETREDFRKFWKERMDTDLSVRIGPDYAESLARYKGRDYPLIVAGHTRWPGFFGPIRNLMGVENLCMAFYDDPAFVEEMMDAFADFMIDIMGKVLEHTDIDIFGFWEDMAYNAAPLISPAMVRKFMLPRYRRVVDFLNSRGVEFIVLDSDGEVSSLIPVWLDSGINPLYPFEVQCGMDVLQVRREYGRDLRIWRGVDKRCAAWGKEAVDREMARIAPLVRDGGYVPGADHSFPPDTPFEGYCYFMEKLFSIL